MGIALETIAAYDTDNAAIGTDIAAVAGSTLTVRNTREGSLVHLIHGAAFGDGEINFRVRSPRLHDNVRGIEIVASGSIVHEWFPVGCTQPLISQDTLIVNGFSAGGAADIGITMTLFYSDLPGVDARLATWDEIRRRTQHILAVQQDLATTTLGVYSAEQAISADADLLKANTDYAILGAVGDSEVLSLNVRGPDTGNLRIGIPVNDNFEQASAHFLKRLNMLSGFPTIPIFNAANKGGTLIDVFHPVALTTPQFSLVLAQLS